MKRTGENATVRYIVTIKPSLLSTEHFEVKRTVRLKETSSAKPFVLEWI